jgi:hypothetical protein
MTIIKWVNNFNRIRFKLINLNKSNVYLLILFLESLSMMDNLKIFRNLLRNLGYKLKINKIKF